MTIIGVVIHYTGKWHNASYQGGEKRLMVIQDDDITYNSFVDRIHHAFGVDVDTKYSITCFIQSPAAGDGTRVTLNITNDMELRFSLNNSVRSFYVTVVSPKPSLLPHLGSPNQNVRIEEVSQNFNSDHIYEETTDFDGDKNENEDIDDDDISLDSLDEDDSISSSPYKHPYLLPNSPHEHIEDELMPPKYSEVMNQWVISGGDFQAYVPILLENIIKPYGRDHCIYLGATFDSKDKLIIAVGLFHIKNKVELYVKRSNRNYYHVKCKHCDFEMRSASSGASKIWRVTHFQEPHTCLRTKRATNISSKVIGAYFAPRLQTSGDVLKPREMVAHLEKEYGFQITYPAALAGRNSAIRMIYGDFNESFQLLPSYLHVVEECNPGSFVSLKTNDADVFEYAYMALGASITGFLNHCRPVIAVDGTPLKGKNKGFMFVAASLDGNDQIFPLAIGIGDKEGDESWKWFLSQVRESFGCPHHLLFVSDHHTGIIKAVKAVYPDAAHGLSYFHLKENLAKFGKDVVTLFGNAAYSYKKELFDICMEKIKKVSQDAYDQLIEIQPEMWSRSYCPVRCYGFLTSNCAKSMNGVLRWARRLPVCALLECVRTLICEWFAKRRDEAFVRFNLHELTLAATKRLEVSLQDSRANAMSVVRVNASEFCVRSFGRRYIVNLSTTSCSCGEFDLTLIPCSHAAAAIVSSKQRPVSYVSAYYTMKTQRAIYSMDVNPTPDRDEWSVPDIVKSRVVLEPNNSNQSAGCPRICSRCKQKGHSRSTCSADTSTSSTQESRPQGLRPRPRCLQIGHTKKARTSHFQNGV